LAKGLQFKNLTIDSGEIS